MNNDEKLEAFLFEHMPVVEDLYLCRLEQQDAPSHQFSQRFERNMKWVKRKEKVLTFVGQKEMLPRKAAIAFLLIFVISVTGVMSVEASRNAVLRFVKNIWKEFTELIISDDPEHTNTEQLQLPKEYHVIYEEHEESEDYIHFKTDTNDEMILERLRNMSFDAYLDTEGIQEKSFVYRNMVVSYFENKGIYQAYWLQGDAWYHLETESPRWMAAVKKIIEINNL